MLTSVRILPVQRALRHSQRLRSSNPALLSTTTPTYASSSSETPARESPHERILGALQQARHTEEARPDRNRYRIRSLNKAIREIEYLDHQLVTEKDVEQLKGVSQGLKKALGKFVKMQNPLSGYLDLARLEDDEPETDATSNGKDKSKDLPILKLETPSQRARNQERARAVGDLQSVPGLGITTAKQLVHLGVESVQQLRDILLKEESNKHDKPTSAYPSLDPSIFPLSSHMTKAQLVNLKYLPHLIQPVTRDEISRVLTLLRSILPSHFQIVPVGAYRRGFPISQRIDVCLFHPLFHPEAKDVPVPSSRPSIISYAPNNHRLSLEQPERRGRVDLAFRSYTFSSRDKSMFHNTVIPSLKSGGLVAQGDMAELSVGQWKWSGIVRVPEWKHSEEVDNIDQDNIIGELRSGVKGETESQMELESLRSRLRALRGNTGTFRKLDLSIAPMHSRATAILCLTGDAEFVRDMKSRAKRMGMVLNEFGLWTYEEDPVKEEGEEGEENENQEKQDTSKFLSRRGPGRPKLKEDQGRWTLIPTPTEESLFASLGLDYVPPEKRNYSFLLSKFHKVGGKLRRGGEEGAGMGVVLKS
ncbi:hypothetical protein EV361DRAFT_870795 [Lentinula raphanica]|nr:hypothetical protein EV361DRAFT_870795 [Lentinula raphanica]